MLWASRREVASLLVLPLLLLLLHLLLQLDRHLLVFPHL
jgi:hypothetical protein